MRHQPAVKRKIGPAFVRTGAPVAARRGDPRHPILRLQSSIGNRAVQRLIGPSSPEEGGPVADAVGEGIQSPEHRLDGNTREFMESRMGFDFNGVRLHTDLKAAASANAINAEAYTIGQDIVFGEGKYSPGTSDGRELLAHELAHVVQQASGPVSGSPAGGGMQISEPSDDFERAADNAAHQALAPETDQPATTEYLAASAAPFAQAAGACRVPRNDKPAN